MSGINAVNSTSLEQIEAVRAVTEYQANPFEAFPIAKRHNVSIHYILQSPKAQNDDDREFSKLYDLLHCLTSECGDVMDALEKLYNEEREPNWDDEIRADFYHEHAQEIAEDLGYVIHKPLRSMK